jgi:hypothetical protein
VPFILNKPICGRGWILFLDEAECLPFVEVDDSRANGASRGTARRGFSEQKSRIGASGNHPIKRFVGLFNTSINLNFIDKSQAKNLWDIETIQHMKNEDISSGWYGFIEWIEEPSYIKNHSCPDCPKHLPILLAVGNWIGSPDSYLLDIVAKLKTI